MSVSVHDLSGTSPELTGAPSKVTFTWQLFVTLSVHEATNLSPTCSSLPPMRISSTPVMSTELRCRVMVGGVMSGVGTGVGVGVGEGVGDVLSSLPPHEVNRVRDSHTITNTIVARNAATREFMVVPACLFVPGCLCVWLFPVLVLTVQVISCRSLFGSFCPY